MNIIFMEPVYKDYVWGGEKLKKEADLKNHSVAVKILLKELVENKVIESLDEIKGVGHRLVHGGDKYNKSVIIDDDVIKTVKELIPLAPLHNPANIMGVEAFRKAIPNAVQVGCFDTAFHQTMDEDSYLYAVPYEWYTKYGVRKYGFHGLSHKYVSQKACDILDRKYCNVIVCHLGGGGSISAVRDGKCIDTSMGFSPLAGLMMGTRCGDIDASIITYIMQKENKSVEEVFNDLNKNSGFLGVSGVSSDSRDIENGIKEGNERCILAQDMYVQKIANYIAMYNNLLNNADVIVFTAGVGENSVQTRQMIVDKIHSLGVSLDKELNNCRGVLRKISNEDSRIPVYIVPTNEELMIAKDTYELIG